jgi:hypothetical protein
MCTRVLYETQPDLFSTSVGSASSVAPMSLDEEKYKVKEDKRKCNNIRI